MKLLVSNTAGIDLPTIEGVDCVEFDEDAPIPNEHLDADAIVLWGLREALASLKDMPNLKLVQSLSAGTDGFLKAGIPQGAILTSGRGLHDRTVSEHTVAILLSLIRQLPQAYRDQQLHHWDDKRGPKPLHSADRVSTLIDSRVLIWGFGSIGQQLAKILTTFGAEVRGVAQSAGVRAGFPVVASDDIRGELPDTDILVMILPSTPSTQGVLNAELLSLLPASSLICNVGRGVTVNEPDLISALYDGSIAGAALDVFAEEPLPADSPLWDAPNCVITSHVAGFRADGGSELVESNLKALLAGRQLRNVVRTS